MSTAESKGRDTATDQEERDEMLRRQFAPEHIIDLDKAEQIDLKVLAQLETLQATNKALLEALEGMVGVGWAGSEPNGVHSLSEQRALNAACDALVHAKVKP